MYGKLLCTVAFSTFRPIVRAHFAQSFGYSTHAKIVWWRSFIARSLLVHRSFIAHKFGRTYGIVRAQFGCGLDVFIAKIRAWNGCKSSDKTIPEKVHKNSRKRAFSYVYGCKSARAYYYKLALKKRLKIAAFYSLQKYLLFDCLVSACALVVFAFCCVLCEVLRIIFRNQANESGCNVLDSVISFLYRY